jgi:hypothetical protein
VAAYEPGHGTAAIVGDALRQTFAFYTLGTAFRTQDVIAAGVVVALLLALGGYGLWHAGGRPALGLSVAYQLAPLLFGLVTLLHTTQFGARFLFLGSPGFLLLIAGAIVLLARPWAMALAAFALLGGMAGYAIHNTTFSDQFTDKGYSRLAAYLADHIGPRDSVVLNGISQSLQYWYYAELRDGVATRVAILPLKADGGGADGTAVDLGQTRRRLDQIIAGSSGIWLVDDDSLRYDPQLDTQRMLAEQASRAFSQGFRGQRLDYYVLGSPGPLAPADAKLDGLTLAQSSKLDRPIPAGQAIPLRLEWQAGRDNPPAFKESLRLLDAGGALTAQFDAPPGAGFWPATWQSGSVRDDRPGLFVPVGTPAGTYELQLVAYQAGSGQPLGPAVDLGPVRVDHSEPQRISAAGLAPADGIVAGERLAGIGLPTEIAAGEKLSLTLLWSGGRTAEPESVPLTFGDTSLVHQIGGGAYPTTEWQPRDVVRDVVSIRVPSGLKPGRYPLQIGDARTEVVKVLPTTRLFSTPPLAHPTAWRFGEIAQLLGYEVAPTPSGVRVHLVWKAVTDTPLSYTVFVHALGEDGKVLAQADVPPGTENWDPGEVIPADYTLTANGSYTLEVGMYDPKSGVRLPVCNGTAGCFQPADHLDLPKS